MSSDIELARAAQQGDQNAFRELVNRYENHVYRIGLKMMRNEQDAEDVLQETFLNAFRHLESFRGDAEFSTWLYRIATNASLMKLRSKKPVSSLDQSDGNEDDELMPRELRDWSVTPEEAALNGEIRAQMDTALDALSESLRAVFVLRDIEGLSVQETASVLGISIPNVKTRLHRARFALRESLSAYMAERGMQSKEEVSE